jgi:hypothetical protein
VFDFFKQSSGTHASPPVFLDIVDNDPDDSPAVQEKITPLYIVISLPDLIFFANFSTFFMVKTGCLQQLSTF